MAVHLHNPESLLPSCLFQSEDESEDAIKPIIGQDQSNGNSWSSASSTTDIWGEQEPSCGSVSSGSGSSESETGDEDYMAELTLQMAQYMFHEDDKLSVPDLSTDTRQKTWGLPTSPQSTLWSPMGSTHWSQNGSSREPSPPVTQSRGWDKQRLAGAEPQPVENPNQAQTDYQLRAIQFYKLKQEQVAKKKQQQGNNNKLSQQNRVRAKARPLPNQWSNSNAGPSLESNRPGSGMRAVFLGGSGSRSGSCGGTGVFLPRVDSSSNPSESRKKLGCSSVLIPARVAEALKLHFDHVGLVSRPNFVAALQHGTEKIQNQKGESVASHQYEVGLPQEWTY